MLILNFFADILKEKHILSIFKVKIISTTNLLIFLITISVNYVRNMIDNLIDVAFI